MQKEEVINLINLTNQRIDNLMRLTEANTDSILKMNTNIQGLMKDILGMMEQLK